MKHSQKWRDYKEIIFLERNYKKSHTWLIYGKSDKNPLIVSLCEDLINKGDLFKIEQKSIKIQDIRNITEFAMYTPLYSKHRIIIIDLCHGITIEASNALLKILEDTPKNTFFFILSDSMHNIIPSIRSRCYKIYLKPNSNIDRDFHKNEILQLPNAINIYKAIIRSFIKGYDDVDQKDKNFAFLLILAISRIIKLKYNLSFAELYTNEISDLSKINGSYIHWYKQYEKAIATTNMPNIEQEILAAFLFNASVD